ncbi:protein of unknown function [Magnetospirillum gryphiswaldense MSR-1 v2]|uniref:Uncharacterized protein n=1 Tax=Magnetospirillum gryphiswaldense (strain DSM 6361 / JCM 21280 / NBRC 15271 / MSR-1) TaxID=431944 RepID=V6F320_MAGGM|nr:hypothetical protein [Magnetospirillum gryphiswaldense]CDK99772.1 protein of unknown function [Magnetospirillum gryphiswaldense MSR-1 v2]
MSIASLRGLIETIKGRGQTLAAAAGEDGASARDLVYLAKAVESMVGADALLGLLDEAGKPAEIVTVASPGTATLTLTEDQVARDVVVLRPDQGDFTAAEVVVVAPSRGWAVIIDNELPVPVRIKTAIQTVAAVSVAPGNKGWLFCDGGMVDHVFDVTAAIAAAASPLAVRGDLYVRDGSGNTRLPLGAASKFLGSNGTDPQWLLPPGRTNSRAKYLANDFIARDADDNLVAGGNAVSLVATPRLANLISDAVVFPDHANLGIWDADSQSCMTSIYRGLAAVFQDGGLSVWGNSNSGRNGDPNGSHWPHFQPALYRTTNEGHLVTENLTDAGVKQVYGNYGTTMILLENGELYATGYGGHGQQGDGTTSSKSFFQRIVFPGDAGPVRYVVSTCMTGPDSSAAFYALMEDGDVYSWGYNGYGQLGHGDTGNRTIPTKIAAFERNVQCIVAAGGSYGFAHFVTTDNKLFGCGYNGTGNLGDSTTANKPAPVLIDAGPVVKCANTGYGSHNFAFYIKADGKLYAMGFNESGQLGDNSATNRSTPVLVGNLGLTDPTKVIDIWAYGARYSAGGFALTKNGQFWAWGSNVNGQLGLGDTNSRQAPVLVPGVEHVSQVVSPTTGISQATQYHYNSVLLLRHASAADRIARRNGYPMAAGWGGSFIGAPNASNPTTVFRYVGFPPKYHGRIRRIGCSGYHDGTGNAEQDAYALAMDGTVFAWGPSSNYALGDWMNTSTTCPQPLKF